MSRHRGRQWERFWRAAGETRGVEGWAAWAGGEMAAFLLTVLLDDGVEFLLARSRNDRLDAYPNNAVFFTVAEEMLVRRGLREITFGLESLESVGPLDEFKYGMGFKRRALRQRVVFHPILRPLLGRESLRRWIRGTADTRGRGGAFWRKAAGLLRFAEEGGDLNAGAGSRMSDDKSAGEGR